MKNAKESGINPPADVNNYRDWPEYKPWIIEPKWQNLWEETGLYRTREAPGANKYYCLDFFPYPSGEGLHVGHCRNYVPTDVIARDKRMSGFNVLHPMGWDAFGEPAEQFAIAHNVHPRITTDQNTANFKRQMKSIGTSYDWRREIDSSQPEFYRWTQWFFLLLYRKGLAYRDMNWQWWCPTCQTTLSSHEAIGGVCWRGHSGITKREIPAWYFRITAYADELQFALEDIDWPEPIKTMQRNWIGRSEGVEIEFRTRKGQALPVFTTRPDTIFGATFFVIAPEHPLVSRLTTSEQKQAVESYVKIAIQRSEIERMSEAREKTGVFTGSFVINPINGVQIPVWVADYVLPSYGSGAIMGVPAHDQRDFEFAQNYGLEIRWVISSDVARDQRFESAYTGPGKMINSGQFDGISNTDGIERITTELEERKLGWRTVQYRMRDWLISRQRYWGTPIPIVYCDNCGEVPVPEQQLPVLLPNITDFAPDGSGRSPLARVPQFVNTKCPKCYGAATRETDTLGGFACSSWYFLRFTSPNYESGPFDPQKARYWMPVDLYVGGAEHAVLHLLYARFWTKVLADAGMVTFREPFSKLLNQGQMMGPDGSRMSKSRGNVVTPDHMIEAYGADALRLYEMFMAPFEQDANWNTDGINGTYRFLKRTWHLYKESYTASAQAKVEDLEVERWLHKTIRDVTERIEDFRLNTMVSALMEFVNALTAIYQKGDWRTRSYHRAMETLLVLMAPAAPHISEEIWRLTGHPSSVHQEPWPQWNPRYLQEEVVDIAVQVDGKVRATMIVERNADQDEVASKARSHPKVSPYLVGSEVVTVIYIPRKIISIVTRKI